MKLRTLIASFAALAGISIAKAATDATGIESIELYPLSEVRLGNAPEFTSRVAACRQYLLTLKADRLLAPFRREAELPPLAESYGNWESSGLDGHMLGHCLSACANLIAAGHDEDGELRRMLDTLVDGLAVCQAARGDGSVDGIPRSKVLWRDLGVKHDIASVRRRWVPWYNVHKTFAGLRDAWELLGHVQAKKVFDRMVGWADRVTVGLASDEMQRMLDTEFGGMNEVLPAPLARRFDHQKILHPLQAGRDELTGKHANTQIPKVLGFAAAGEWTAVETFWNSVVGRRTVAFGGNSCGEHFRDPKDCVSTMLHAAQGPETCNTHNMLRLTEKLFCHDPQPRYAAYYEKALFNHVLSSFDPQQPGFVYFTQLYPGAYRMYSQPETNFWCCVGTGLEAPGRYGAFIYAHRGNDIYVNLFVDSQLKDILRQETRFPMDGRTRITVLKPFDGDLYVRKGDRYERFVRDWKAGDVVEVEVPMDLHVEKLPDGSDWGAYLRGPIVLAKVLPTEEDLRFKADGSRMGHVIDPKKLPPIVESSLQNIPREDIAWNSVTDGWSPDYREGGMARLSFQYGEPVHPNTAKHLRIEAFGTGRAGVRNRGLDGIWIKKGEPYRLSYDWREIKREGVEYKLGAWKREVIDFCGDAPASPRALKTAEGYEILLEPDGDQVTLSLLVKGRRVVEFDNVSLQPTGPNLVRVGLRKDLVDRLAALRPAFLRFPGGCIVEEGDFQHWYDWRRTVGPKERRECIQNRWATAKRPYWETFGVGYFEYFRLCEEIGAEPLPICLAGLTCQYQKPPLMCAVQDADYFANVILELIEFANGDVSTTWGKVRAEMGHPAPFNLKMVGIGNENWNAEFFDRMEPIARIVRSKHPEIKIVGSSGPKPDGREFSYAWNRVTRETADLVDEHFYRNPEWFLKNVGRYDGYDRTKPHVYVGEYACHHRVEGKKVNTLWSAVCEAAIMTGYERNSDVVEMASYAPLFARLGHDQWAPNLIWFDGTTSWVTPNYYVQQLFAVHRPDETVTSTVDATLEGFFQTCGYDRTTSEYILKCVNASESARSLTITSTFSLPKGEVRIISMAGGKNDMNDLEHPTRCVPTESRLAFDGGKTFTLQLPAVSVSIIRIPISTSEGSARVRNDLINPYIFRIPTRGGRTSACAVCYNESVNF